MADLLKDYNHVQELKAKATTLLSPRTPITTQELFSGRYDQITKLQGAIAQTGAHAIVYGERGVGKTSLANVAPIAYCVHSQASPDSVVAPKVNCDGTDSFDSLWRKVFRAVEVNDEEVPYGFLAKPKLKRSTLLDKIADTESKFTPGDVQRVLASVCQHCRLIVTLDEFDRLPAGSEVPRLIADTIKSLSDNQIAATLVAVGVGDSISTLVQGHESVGRHLVEVPLPRMSRGELEKIVTDRLKLLDEMEIDDGALRTISLLCTGLPYFTHLLGQHAVLSALNSMRMKITQSDVNAAMQRAIEDSEREMKSAYYEATLSRQPNSQFKQTLAACALTKRDEFGYFTQASIRDALAVIHGEGKEISSFTKHLDRFCDSDKGGILQLTGGKHQKRYRFRDPLMQPFTLINSIDQKIIKVDHIKAAASK